MTQKFSTYFYWECQTIYSNSYLKLHISYLFHLFVDMYMLKGSFKKKLDYARLIFSLKKFQEMGTKSLFLTFQNSFSASYFQYLKNHLTKIIHWTDYRMIIERSNYSES